jgi:hypothetical protein
MQSLFPALIIFIFKVICYGVGRVVITGFTFGRIRCETLYGKEDFGWFGRKTISDGSYILSALITTIVGLIALSLAIVLGMIAYRQIMSPEV